MSIKEKLVESISKGKQDGWTLIHGDWGNKEQKCACALGCLLVTNDHGICDDPEQNAVEAAHVLGVSETWINSFISGFDGTDHDSSPDEVVDEAVEIGKQIRSELNPMSDVDFSDSLEKNKEDDSDDHYY